MLIKYEYPFKIPFGCIFNKIGAFIVNKSLTGSIVDVAAGCGTRGLCVLASYCVENRLFSAVSLLLHTSKLLA